MGLSWAVAVRAYFTDLDLSFSGEKRTLANLKPI